MRELAAKNAKFAKGIGFVGATGWSPFLAALFEAQDDIDRRREQIIAEIEGKLPQRVSQKRLFSIRWSLA